MEEIVAKGVLLRKLAFRQVCRIDVAEDESRIVAPGDEFVQVAVLRFEQAIINLQLLVIKSVHDVTCDGIGRDVSREVVGNQAVAPGCFLRSESNFRANEGNCGSIAPVP